MTVAEPVPIDFAGTEPVEGIGTTGAAAEQLQMWSQNEDASRRPDWRAILDRFDDWSQEPDHIDEDEWESPSLKAIETGRELASWMFRNRSPIPSRVAMSGEGGIVFECNREHVSESIEIDAAGRAEYRRLVNGRLIVREPLTGFIVHGNTRWC